MRTSAEFLSDLQPVIDRIAGGPMNARVQPLFPVSAELDALKHRAVQIASKRYDDGFNAGEAVGYAEGVREGRQETSFYIVATGIAFGTIGVLVGAGAAMAGWFV